MNSESGERENVSTSGKKQDMLHLCCVFLCESRLTGMKYLVSPGEQVSEMFVGGCFGSKDDLCLALPLTLCFPSSLSWSQDYPSMHRGSLPVCLCQAQIWVKGLLSSDASVSLTNKRKKNTDTLNEHVCACIEIWTFFILIEWVGSCICVFTIDWGWVRSVYEWIRPSPVFLHCSASTVICPP